LQSHFSELRYGCIGKRVLEGRNLCSHRIFLSNQRWIDTAARANTRVVQEV